MSRAVTSTVRQKETTMVHSPMHLDSSPRDVDLRPGRHSPSAQRATSTPTSSSTTMTRNHAASKENVNVPRTDLRINTTGGPESSSDNHICMCTPPHHVPRPCNSFILYRTRMASQAIAENPGASNPQISKILGDRWAKESDEVKAQWKQKAEEESKRHRQQYPGYRFQPKRRGSKNYTPGRGGSDDNPTERCPKCNGIRAAQAQTPATPAKSAGEATTPSVKSEHSSQGRRAVPMSAGGHVDRGSVRHLEDDGYRAESPEAKRRRLAHTAGGRGMMPIDVPQYDRRHPAYGNYTPSPAGYDPQGRYYRQTGTPVLQHGEMPRQHHVAMPPPPRPPTWDGAPYQYPMRPGPGDESVRLPPLKTALTPTTPGQDSEVRFGYPTTPATGLGILSARDSPEQSAQEQIMSLSFSRKMAVVGKICPPLPRSGAEGRGAIIAVEGPQRDVLQYVSQVVEKTLQVCQNARLRSWSHDDKFDEAKTSGNPETELQDLMPSIFQEILGWHEKSKEMVRHVTGGRTQDSSSPNQATSSPSKDEGEPGNKATTAPESASPASNSTSVALIKDGFSLTLSDRFACATSHSLQQYSPIDHWQWMATLWRGIVGPDLVVHVKPIPEEDMDKLKTVEFQKSLGVMVVRVPTGKSSLDEATERRLNFEVIEWIADMWPKMSTRG